MDRWVRTLAATLSTGRSVTDAIRVSRRTAPPAIAEEVEVLVLRLNSRWDTRTALQRFADHGDLFEPVLHGRQALGPALRELRHQ